MLGGSLCTPPRADGPLPGITRNAVVELAAAQEVLLTNSLIGIRAPASIDGRSVGAEAPGPVTRQLAAADVDLTQREKASRA